MTFQAGFADLVIVILLAGLTTAEVITYIFFICYQWLLAAGILTLWGTTDRPWSAILLGTPATPLPPFSYLISGEAGYRIARSVQRHASIAVRL
jgi:hypothetical protein